MTHYCHRAHLSPLVFTPGVQGRRISDDPRILCMVFALLRVIMNRECQTWAQVAQQTAYTTREGQQAGRKVFVRNVCILEGRAVWEWRV